MRRSTFLAVSSWPVEIQVSPQHSGSVGIVTRPAGVLEQLDGRLADVRVEVIGEGVRPEQDGAAQPGPRPAAPRPPLLQRLAGEQRDLARLEPGRTGGEPRQQRCVAQRVDHAGQPARADHRGEQPAASPSRSASAGRSRPA